MISHFYQKKGRLEAKEDSLTSLTFDGLKYLPDELFWSVLNSSLIIGSLPKVTAIDEIFFWQHWSAGGTSNTNFVEPDVFIRTEMFDVIIEAKRWDKNQQSITQRINQITAYYNDFSEDNKLLYYIELGGLYNTKPEINLIHQNQEVVICKTNWTNLLLSIVRHYQNLDNLKLKLFNPQKRVLEDIIKGFELHQFYTMKWFGDFKAPKIYSNQFEFLKFKISFNSTQERLITPLKNLSQINITTTSTHNLFEYAKSTQ